MDFTIVAGVVMFTVVVVSLVALILVARSNLVATGNVHIGINDDDEKGHERSCVGCLGCGPRQACPAIALQVAHLEGWHSVHARIPILPFSHHLID